MTSKMRRIRYAGVMAKVVDPRKLPDSNIGIPGLRDNSKLTSQIRCNGVVPFRWGGAVFEAERGYQTRVRFEAGRIFFSVQIRRSEEHTSELQSRQYLVCRLLLEKK